LTAPFDIVNTKGGTYAWYAIQLDSIYTDGSSYDEGVRVRIDSGNPFLMLPPDVTTAFNDLWGVSSDGTIDCSVVAPDLWIGIGGDFIYINPLDLTFPDLNGDGTCSSAVIPTPAGGPFWLGDPFLKSVVALFDWGNQVME
jgi:hypothetical protein